MVELKRTPARISLFEALKIPEQIDLLKISLIALNEGMERVLNLFEISKYLGMGKNKPPAFYMTLEIEGYVLHNCLVDFGVATTVMPKEMCDVMGLPMTRTSTEVLQLDSTPIKIVGVIKDIVLKIHKCPSIIITQVVVVELPPLFGLCLSREFTVKIGDYLAMDYTHYLIPCGNKRVRLNNEEISEFHVEKKEEVCTNFGKLEESDELLEELQIEDPCSMSMLNTIYDLEFGNYYLMEPESFTLELTRKYFWRNEIWEMSFDGAKSKNRFEARITLTNPTGKVHKFAFRLTWLCSNNAAEYEALCLGLEQAIKMEILCLKIKRDLKLIVK